MWCREDILIACVDGVTDFDNVIEVVYPKTEIQQCIIHQIRNTIVFYKDIKVLVADWKRFYAAADGKTALYELEAFGKKWTGKNP